MTTRAIFGGQMATSGSKIFLTKQEEVAQNIETRLRWFYGEAFLDRQGGTPWFQTILGKASGPEREAAIKRAILGTDGVEKMTAFSLDVEDHTIIVTGSVLTIYSAESVQFTVEI